MSALLETFGIALPAMLAAASASSHRAGTFSLSLRSRKPAPSGDQAGDEQDEVTHATATWDAKRTAVIVCDVWNKHWCVGASQRVDELVPQINRLLNAARNAGALIVHAPSDTLDFYEGSPQRERARNAPQAAAPADIRNWLKLDPEREGALPIDDSDGGCDDTPVCPPFKAWTRQHPGIEIAANDAISDDGAEVFNLFALHGIENVIVLGVHTNMCVLGRPFGIRRMVGLGKNVVLMRDLTDALYNSRRAPYVTHFQGTDMMIAHIERHWCSTITSDQIAGGLTFRFADDAD